MDVMEKLVELIRKGARGHTFMPTGTIANYLVENGVTVQEWVSVDEPPKKNGYYLVYTESGEIIRGYYKGYYWLVGNDGVTHWMPLPQPPKGE